MPILGIMASQISGHLIPPSSFYSIATVTAAGGETSLSFTSIPSTYKSLQIRSLVRTNGGANASYFLYATYNSDSTAGNYDWHYLLGQGSVAYASGSTSTGNVIAGESASSGSTTGIFGTNIMDIIDYASSSKYKTSRVFWGANGNTAGGFSVGLASGLWQSTSAITSISITGEAVFAAGSTFALYGVK